MEEWDGQDTADLLIGIIQKTGEDPHTVIEKMREKIPRPGGRGPGSGEADNKPADTLDPLRRYGMD